MMTKKEIDANVYSKEYFLKINDGWGEFGEGKLGLRFLKAISLANMEFSGKNVLDIGFGRGELLVYLAKRAKCYGIDYSKASVEIATKVAKKNKIKINLEQKDIAELDFPKGYFDAIFMLDIVEHLTDEQLKICFDKVFKILSPKGVFIVHTMPNKFLASPFYLLSKLTGTERGINKEVHINEQTPFSLKNKLKHFNTKIFLAHEKNYFKNTQFYAKHRTVIKPFIDFFLIHDFSKIPILNNFLAAEIWAVCKK